MLNKLLCLPYDAWMQAFLPPQDHDADIDDKAFDGLFDGVPLGETEPKMYDPFVKAVNAAGILADFVLAKTFVKPDLDDKDGLKVDGGMYPKDCPAVTTERTDWASVEVFIECKPDNSYDPYDETTKTGFPFADDRRNTLGQISTYASRVFEYQQLTHHFGVVLLGTWARLGRWDRSGVVFSSVFDYKQEPAKLARFFYRVAHASAEARGHDPTATRVVKGSEDYKILQGWAAKAKAYAEDPSLAQKDYVGKQFVDSLNKARAWWRLRVEDDKHGVKDFLVGKPTFSAPGVIGRGTRGYIGLSISDPGTPFVYLKDCWRVVHDRSQLEGDILSYLNKKGVSNVPTALYHGDVGTQRTLSQTFWTSLNPKRGAKPAERSPQDSSDVAAQGTPKQSTKESVKKDKCPLKTHQHYRLVVREVGLPLKAFPTGDILVASIADAMRAHEEAFNIARVMHRDISVGNILILPGSDGIMSGYRGLLADWELSKHRDEEGKDPRHPDRTGTWQFMSVHTLSNPTVAVQIADELESFLHVMIYCAIRYLPHTCKNVGEFMYKFFDDGIRVGESQYTCGKFKHAVLMEARLRDSNHHPIVFLKSPPLPQSEPDDTPADTQNSPLQGHSSSSASVILSPPPASTAAQTIPQENMHPINDLFTTLLKWFSARYQLLEPAATAEPQKKPDQLTLLQSRLSAEAWQRALAVARRMAPPKPQQKSVEELEVIAENIKTHENMFALLVTALGSIEWPTEDKMNDQLDARYNPNKPLKVAEKRSAPDEQPQGSKQPDSKRRCSAASRS
ncbi:hypothetical protein PYCCODRAFT_1393929 [Trametes coccinea BRFM310]|uniref:Fungal-type protein kinase domain-containing protein n=1 Tax=Trametes coccinea (strain BRFM310) TaxID=1353009 RepID=A0A1Y2IIB2_TRAC3|nr:hypothetical protein PYCCODRAFT_1393929 [Trametes coccinea BRFM310]